MQNLDQYSKNILILCIVLFFFAFLSLLISLFTSLSINYDAKAKGIKNRVLFSVLGFFFPFIMAIVYLIVRNNLKKIQPKICNCCGLTVDTSTTVCPKCSSSQFTDYLIRDNEKFRKRAKVYSITTVVLYIISLIFSFVIQLSGFFYTANFARDKSDYNYDNGYQYDYDDDNDSFDYDDFFDQFNSGQYDSDDYTG